MTDAMTDAPVRTVLVVVESSFGNTLAVAHAMASALHGPPCGLDTTVTGPDAAPTVLDPTVDLLLVGAPTHAFSLPTARSRAEAVSKGADPATSTGLREWIATLTPSAGLRVVTFDTSIPLRFAPGCAAKTACKLLRKRGFPTAERGPSFHVTGTPGPLADGELARAAAWATQLVQLPVR